MVTALSNRFGSPSPVGNCYTPSGMAGLGGVGTVNGEGGSIRTPLWLKRKLELKDWLFPPVPPLGPRWVPIGCGAGAFTEGDGNVAVGGSIGAW